jgi:hypothetical protein
MPGARGVSVFGVAPGRHREQLGEVVGARRRLRPGAREGRSGQQRTDPVEVAGIDEFGVAVQQLGDRQPVVEFDYAT